MDKYKKIIPCIFIEQGNAVKWINDKEVLTEDVVGLAKGYYEKGADELLILDLSDDDDDHEETLNILRRITRVVRIPVVAGGNVKRMEDVKKILYAGAKRAIINFSRTDGTKLLEAAEKRFGKDKVAVSLNDFDTLFKQRKAIEEYTSEIVFMHRLDIPSVMDVTDIPCVILTDAMDKKELLNILKFSGVKGISGRFVSQPELDIAELKLECEEEGISMTTFESIMDFSSFKLNEKGLLPVIVQHYKTQEVLMLAYMNEEAFKLTVETGRMTYFSRSRNALWVKGETSGNYQHVKSLTIDCDNDTLLAKVEQVGVACHTGNPTCFFQPIAGVDYNETNPLRIFETLYEKIVDRKVNPKEGSYTNYLFDKGIDKILKKVGEEATEIVIAAKNPNPEEIKYEIADFLYHIIVLMVEKGVTWEDITKELSDR